MNRYKFTSRNEAGVAALRAVPGVRIDDVLGAQTGPARHEVTFGLNAWQIVRATLPELNLPERPLSDVAQAELARRAARMRDALRPDVEFKKYQLPGIQQMLQDGLGLLRWPPGGGKSLAGIAVLLGLPAPRLILTRACNREGYVRELAKWSRCATSDVVTGHDNDGREVRDDVDFVIVAVETLQWHTARIVRLAPRTVLIDESDLVKNNMRWKAIPALDGAGTQFVRRHNRAASAQDILVAADFRIATTATPFPNKPIDGWAQGDLIEPGAWGGKSTYAARYCSRRENPHGGYDDSGASALDELRARWAMISHEVSDEELRAEMPPVRVEPAFIGFEDQTRIEDKDLSDIAAEHGADTDGGLMRAALAARGYVAAKVEEVVRSGRKAVVLTGWRADAERTAAALRAVLNRRGGALDVVPVTCIHGGNSTSKNRLGLLQPFIEAPAGALLVATYDSVGRALDGLQVAAYCAFQMLPFTVGALEQAIGRFPRLGRTIPCLIELCIPLRTYAERVAGILIEKSRAVAELAPTELASGLEAKILSGGTQRAFDQLVRGIGGADDGARSGNADGVTIAEGDNAGGRII